MILRVNPLRPESGNPSFAGEVLDADLHVPPSPALVAAVEDAMAKYAVVVLRDAAIDDEEQLRFARAFGPLELPPHWGLVDTSKPRVGHGLYDISNLDEHGELLAASSVKYASNKANEEFHTDSSFNALPTKWSMLSARVIPPEGGDTEFCDGRAAFEALTPELKARAEEAVAEHWYWHTRGTSIYNSITEDMRRAMPPVRHPVVRTVDGRQTLYLGAHATHIVGWPRADGEHFIAELNAHLAQPGFRYRHEWQPADLLIWDNRCVLHRATAFDSARDVRDMRRATINEYGPEISSTDALGVPAPQGLAG
jgi:alpha-ketoglutarate-dependent 2,4-dichlorophenoxyacetate dioxygenase